MQLDLVVVEAGPGASPLSLLLSGTGANVRAVASVDEALEAVNRQPPDAVVLDVEGVGASLAAALRRFEGVPVIAVGRGGVKEAVAAVHAGARDYLEIPFDAADFARAMDTVLAGADAGADAGAAAAEVGLRGTSRPMAQVNDLVRRVAPTDATALVRGESGTGKELVAQALHAASGRRTGPFVKVHCAGLPESLLESELFGYERGAFTGATLRKPGRVEVADGGTLFFDEIGDVPLSMQVKLLRLFQDRQYERLGGKATLTANVRFIAATHRDLEHMVKKGEFREDLFYRLNVVPLWLPPLRARRGDIAELGTHFCDAFARAHGKIGTALSDDAVAALAAERWPGNVRQLQNFIERLVVLAESFVITAADVARELSPPAPFATDGSVVDAESGAPSLSAVTRTGPIVPLDATLRAAERAAIERALRHVKGNRLLAARLLGVGRATLYKKIVELKIDGRTLSEAKEQIPMTTSVEFAHGPSTIRLGDLEVVRLGYGAMRLPGPEVWGEPQDPARAREVLRRVVRLGINLIDSAWYYGPHVSNRLIAEALHPYPRDLVIASKLGGKRLPDKGWAPFCRPEELREGCETDLRELRRDVLDVVHLRYMGKASPVPFAESLEAMIGLQKEGKIRHLALSNVGPAELEFALARTPIVSVQNLYSVSGGGGTMARLTHAEVDSPERVLEMCEERGIAFMPFFPLGVGAHAKPGAAVGVLATRHGVTPAQIALAWLLARSKVMLPIPGTSSPEHLEENWAARTVKLSPEEVASVAASARGE